MDDGGGDFTQALVRQADDGHVGDFFVAAQEVFDLYRIQVFTAGDNNILFPVHQIVEAVLVLAGHVAGPQPAVVEDFRRGLGVFIVADHDAVAAEGQLAYLAVGHVVALLVYDAGFPAETGFADGAHLVDVLHAQMDRAGADGFRKAVVGVVLVMGEQLHPTVNHAGRHRLGADVHEPPLVQHVVVGVNAARFDGFQQVLTPGHQKPDDGAFFLGNGPENPLGLDAPEQNGLAAGVEGAEPVHFCAGVVQGRNAEEHVVPGLAVVGLFGAAGGHQCPVFM